LNTGPNGFFIRLQERGKEAARSAGDKKYDREDEELGDGFRRKKKHWDMNFASRINYVRPFKSTIYHVASLNQRLYTI
jgi:hypothetical protein